MFQGGASFVDPFCYLCFMFVVVMLSCRLLAVLLLPDLLAVLYVMCSGVLSLSHMVFQVMCGTSMNRLQIFAFSFTLIISL